MIEQCNDQGAIAAIILAGGQSSRMGQDKALLEVNGRSLLQRTCEVAKQCCSSVYVVTPWGDRYQSIIPNDCQLVAEIPAPDEYPPHGPLVGFAQGLATVETDWVLLLACDLPRLDSEILNQWRSQLSTLAPSVIALLPKTKKDWEPLCGFYRRSCHENLQQFIETGGRSFQRWLASQQVEPLTISDHSMLFNCNTPNDLDQVT